MQRRRLITVLAIIILVLITSLAVFHFTRPSVAFIASDSFPPGYRLPSPYSFFKYRRTGNAGNADLVIVAPDAAVPAGVEAYLFGRDAEEVESPAAVLAIDEERMWESAAADGSFAVIYEESSSRAAAIASHLAALNENAVPVTYMGRISSANIGQVVSAVDASGADTLLMLTPETSMELIRDDGSRNVIMDIRDAAAMETTEVESAVSIDWDASVENLLSGKAELSYCLLSL